MIAGSFLLAWQFFLAVIGWMVLGPLTYVVPRRSGLYVFVGRDGGAFLDNCKHLFCFMQASGRRTPSVIFLTDQADLRRALREHGASAARLGGLRGMAMFLRSGTILVDSVDWSRSWRFAASRGARVVQLWHGTPLKEIELALYRKQLRSVSPWARPMLRVLKKVTGRYARFDVLLCTSRFVAENAFARCFHARRISPAGYPRNDVLLAEPESLPSTTWINVDAQADAAISRHHAAERGKVVLYAPTFRKGPAAPFEEGGIDLEGVSRVAEELGLLILIKLHPWMQAPRGSRDLPGVQFVATDSDVYPLLRNVDALVTDYSSIYFDFLLLDRPVVFFCYDLDRYARDDRALLFDYPTMTPGTKALTMGELVATLRDIAAGADGWSAERARVRSLVFDHVDHDASKRLLAELD